MAGVILAYLYQVVVEVGGEVVAREAHTPRAVEGEDPVLAREAAERHAVAASVEAQHRAVEPYLAGFEGGDPVALLGDVADGVAGEDIAHGLPALDGEFGKVEIETHLLQLGAGGVVHRHHLGFAVGVGGEIENLRVLGSLGEVVFHVVGDADDGEALHKDVAHGSVAINHVIDRAVVAAAENADVLNLLAFRRANKGLFLHPGDYHGAVGAENDEVVHLRAVEGVLRPLVLLQPRAGETGEHIDVELLVGHRHAGGQYLVETAYLGSALPSLAVGGEDVLEIGDRIVGEVGQVVASLLNVGVNGGNLLLGLLDVEVRDFADGLFAQLQHMVAGNLLAEESAVGVESPFNACHLSFPRLEVTPLQHLVYPLLEKQFLQRHPMPAVLQLGKQYFQFLSQQVLGAEGGVAEYFAGSHEDRLVVHNHAGLRRKADLAVCEGIECVNHLVGRNARRQRADNLHLGGGVVIHLLHLNLPLLVGFENTVYQHISGDAIRHFGDDDSLALLIVVHTGADAEAPPLGGIVVLGHVDKSACREVGEYFKRLVPQYLDGGLNKFAEVVGQDDRGESDGNALGPLCQQQGKLDGQRHGLLLTPVV